MNCPQECPAIAQLRADIASLRAELANVPRLHLKDLQRRYGVSESTIKRWRVCGRLPRPRWIAGRPIWAIADLEHAERHPKADRPRRQRRTPKGGQKCPMSA